MSTETKGSATAGIVLWVIVLAGLLYGIVETVARVVDLFA